MTVNEGNLSEQIFRSYANPAFERQGWPSPSMKTSSGLHAGEEVVDDFPCRLNDEQLLRLKKAVYGCILDGPDSSGFKLIKTFVDFATRVAPENFDHILVGLDKSAVD